MPLRFKLITTSPIPRLDARELVERAGDAARDAVRDALVGGYDPETGEPRQVKDDGKPIGYRTGTLANGLQRTEVTGSRARARTTVIPPASRADWVADRGDVLVADGAVDEAVKRAGDDYLDEL